jgi:hypothetical protein
MAISHEGSHEVSQKKLSKTTITFYFNQVPMMVTTWGTPTMTTFEI